jgi:hypothetical protein
MKFRGGNVKRILLLALIVWAVPSFGQTQMACRDLKDSGGFLYAGETVVNGQACKQVTYAPAQQAAFVNTSAPVADPRPALVAVAPVAATPEQPAAVPVAVPVASSVAPKECLIVTSAEGHRFRNSMIAGVLTGGIGLVAGAAFSGGRYEYRDSYNLPSSDVKVKYKGPELQGFEQKGVHVIVVNKKDKTGTEVKDARTACQQ